MFGEILKQLLGGGGCLPFRLWFILIGGGGGKVFAKESHRKRRDAKFGQFDKSNLFGGAESTAAAMLGCSVGTCSTPCLMEWNFSRSTEDVWCPAEMSCWFSRWDNVSKLLQQLERQHALRHGSKLFSWSSSPGWSLNERQDLWDLLSSFWVSLL